MPYRVVEIQPTPNPNAAKFLLDRAVSDGTISFRAAEQAKDHPLASKLFGIEGVTGLMFLGDFITINKNPEADWKSISAKVKAILTATKNEKP